MPRFRVTVYDRVVRTFDKEFEAPTAAAARALADAESVTDAGWQEHYSSAFSEQHIEGIAEVEGDPSEPGHPDNPRSNYDVEEP